MSEERPGAANQSRLSGRIRDILISADPIGIYFADVDNRDEYDGEVAAIVAELPRCLTESGVQNAVWSVFVRYFSPQIAGDPADYASIASEVWRVSREEGAPRARTD
jgi:hypothetical protein